MTNKTAKCLAACSTTYYNSITASTSNYPDPRTFMNTAHSCTLAKKLVDTCKDFRRAPLEEAYRPVPRVTLYLSVSPRSRWDRYPGC